MNPRIKLAVLATAIVSANVLANEIEEVIITSSINDQSASSVKGAIHVLGGDSIELSATQSLGESLDGLAGVYSADYGAGVGQPVIRGMSGSRIKILNNGKVVRDVAGIGADHVNEVDMNNIEQVEIIRGPSSLLYANGAIGGIVNIVDNAIAKKDFSESELKIGLEAQSVNDGDSQNLSYENNLGGLNLSFAFKDSQFGNFDVPTGAILHDEDHDEHEEHGDEDHDEHGDEDHDEHE
jgi:iron complex outermembrane receptor protein